MGPAGVLPVYGRDAVVLQPVLSDICRDVNPGSQWLAYDAAGGFTKGVWFKEKGECNGGRRKLFADGVCVLPEVLSRIALGKVVCR